MTPDYTAALQEFSVKAEATGCKVLKDEPLKKHTTFKTGGCCPLMLIPENTEQLVSVLSLIKEASLPFFVIGRGSNLLVADEGTQKIIVKIADDKTPLKLEGEDTIVFPAGAKVTELCKFALSNSLSGLEFAYGIPGTCGGAVFMNAGAYGGEFKDVLTEITHITPELKIETIPACEAELSYRSSVYKTNNCIILSARVKLNKGDKTEIKNNMDDFLSRRKDKQPLEFPSAGSTFKRPEGNFAGKLIQDCSLKGYSIGGAQVSEKHAGFVINKGDATSADILNLINHIQTTVQKETGVLLEPEVIIVK